MGVVQNLRDRLTNVMTGMGTTADRRTAGFYAFMATAPEQAEAAYRTSWLVRKIVDVPPLDMTRAWRDWQADDKAIEALEAEEKRLQLAAKCKRALVLSRLYGGGAIILGTAESDPTQELRPDRLGKGGLTYLHVMSRHQLNAEQPITDPASPWFGRPSSFTINSANGQSVRLHPSRVVEFIGQPAPEGSRLQADWFWGDPIMQSIGDAVKNADLAQAGFASLIDEAKIDIIKIPNMMEIASTAGGEQRLLTRLSLAAVGKSTHRALMLDGGNGPGSAGEEWEQRQITWAGMPDIISSYLNIVAGAADIPVTRLLGQSPKGLQSTGDGEERDYHAMIRARQDELLAPALDRIDELLIRSALGTRPSDVYYEFAPLSQMDPKQAADIEKTKADTIKVYADSGHLQDSVLTAMARGVIVEGGQWPGSEKAFEEADASGEVPGGAEEDDLLTEEERLAKAKAETGSAADA